MGAQLHFKRTKSSALCGSERFIDVQKAANSAPARATVWWTFELALRRSARPRTQSVAGVYTPVVAANPNTKM